MQLCNLGSERNLASSDVSTQLAHELQKSRGKAALEKRPLESAVIASDS